MLIPKKAAELERWLSGYVPELDYASIEQKANISTRQSSASFLGYLAEHVGNMIVSSADLANSDKTDGFLKKTHAFQGRRLHRRIPARRCERAYPGCYNERYSTSRRRYLRLRHILCIL